MSNLTITNTFSPNTTIASGQMNTNFSDVKTWLNNRDNATDFWLNMKVSGTTSNPGEIKSSSTDCEFDVDCTGTNGTPRYSLRRSGTTFYTWGVDGAASNLFKFATTALTTNVAFQVPTTGVQVQFPIGSASVPGVSFIGRVTTGLFSANDGEIDFTSSGTTVMSLDSNQLTLLGGVDLLTNNSGATIGNASTPFARIFMASGSASAPAFTFQTDTGQNTGMFLDSQDGIGFSGGGTEIGALTAGGTTNDTSLWVYDVTAAALHRVSRGASDSGGTGFRVLRIAN